VPAPVGGSDAGGSAGGGSSPAPTATPVPAAGPSITLRLSDDRVDNGETFTVRLETSSDAGVDSMWWWATSTNDNALRDTHTNNCRGSNPCNRSWDVSTTDDGNKSKQIMDKQEKDKNDLIRENNDNKSPIRIKFHNSTNSINSNKVSPNLEKVKNIIEKKNLFKIKDLLSKSGVMK